MLYVCNILILFINKIIQTKFKRIAFYYGHDIICKNTSDGGNLYVWKMDLRKLY